MSDSDSDSSSDEDYIPEGEVVSSDGRSDSDHEDRHDNTGAGRDRTKADDGESEVEEKNKEERLKQLWDSFKQSTKPAVKPQTKTSVVSVTKTYDFAGEEVKVTETVPTDSSKTAAEQAITKSNTSPTPADNQEAKKTNAKRSSSGLGSVLQQMHKKPKISTLEKSKLDWNLFKKSEGIEEELALHNKDGFLEKQAFLQRTDVRQFEKEREVRLKNFKRLT